MWGHNDAILWLKTSDGMLRIEESHNWQASSMGSCNVGGWVIRERCKKVCSCGKTYEITWGHKPGGHWKCIIPSSPGRVRRLRVVDMVKTSWDSRQRDNTQSTALTLHLLINQKRQQQGWVKKGDPTVGLVNTAGNLSRIVIFNFLFDWHQCDTTWTTTSGLAGSEWVEEHKKAKRQSWVFQSRFIGPDRT